MNQARVESSEEEAEDPGGRRAFQAGNKALSRLCEGCNNIVPITDFRLRIISLGCDHPRTFCKTYMMKIVVIQLATADSHWDEIRCPRCQAFLLPVTIRRYASPTALVEYASLSSDFSVLVVIATTTSQCLAIFGYYPTFAGALLLVVVQVKYMLLVRRAQE